MGAEKKGHPGTIPELLARSVEQYGSRPALTDRKGGQERTFTYEQLGEKVGYVARALASLGIGPGDKCAILGPNSPEWAMAYLASASIGAVCVPVDSLLSKNEIRHIIADAEVRLAFVAPRFLDAILDTRSDYPRPEYIVVLDKAQPEEQDMGLMSFSELEGRGKLSSKRPVGVQPDDLLALIYTSGTTGAPKGVMLSHWNVVSDILACSKAFHINGERFLSVLPMHHTFECTAGFLLPLHTGSHITFARSLKSRDIIEDLKASRATVMFGVPLLFQKMLEGMHRAVKQRPVKVRLAFKGMNALVAAAERAGRHGLGRIVFKGLRQKAGLDSIRMLVAGGAPLHPDVPKGFRRLGINLIQGYGLTEASPVLSVNPEKAAIDCSIGLPLPGVEVKVLNPDTSGVGELAFRGSMIMKGYYRNPQATQEVLDQDGWLRTGDLGYQDEKGYLYISGRAKNLIVSPAGKNIYPEEVEAEINKSPFILESMVYGHPMPNGGEEVRALLVPDAEAIASVCSGRMPSEEEVEKLVIKEARKRLRRVAAYKRPKSFIIRNEELPKTSTKKIKRFLLKI